jgi:hypothetical protein
MPLVFESRLTGNFATQWAPLNEITITPQNYSGNYPDQLFQSGIRMEDIIATPTILQTPLLEMGTLFQGREAVTRTALGIVKATRQGLISRSIWPFGVAFQSIKKE